MQMSIMLRYMYTTYLDLELDHVFLSLFLHSIILSFLNSANTSNSPFLQPDLHVVHQLLYRFTL
jgi:hypothetical protein